MGTQQSAVGNGYHDIGNAFPAVGRYNISNRGCSGTLITPVFLLTANHCITGSCEGVLGGCIYYQGDTNLDVQVRFGPDPAAVAPQAMGIHTFGQSGPIRVRKDGPVDLWPFGDEAAASDIALIQLDERIPLGVLPPLHPPLQSVPPCFQVVADTTDFGAFLVGYGHVGDPAAPGDPVSWRSYQYSSDWYRENTHGHEHSYRNSWLFTSTYEGILKGDSGGALIVQKSGQHFLCGVNSRFYWTDGVAWGSDAAAIDSPPNLNFLLAHHVIDAYGNFMGECNSGPEHLRDVDTDGDLIPDACDPCPTIPDAEYRRTGRFADWVNDDHDKDGVPDACDNCPTRQNGPIAYDTKDSDYYALHHRQRDSDGDGLGDACDRCKKSDVTGVSDVHCCVTHADCNPGSQSTNRCFPVVADGTASSTCLLGFCAESLDRDLDGFGDNCDNCPKDWQLNQNDTDGDGIGDVCDLCTGNHYGLALGPQPADTTVETCTLATTTDADDKVCRDKTGHPESTCVGPRFKGDLGKCTHGRDTDKDKIGDACDGCPTEANDWADIYTVERNCNLHTEVVKGIYPLKPNLCDPNPCPAAAVRTDPNSSPNLEHGLPIWEALEYDPVTLPNQHADAYKYFLPGGTLPNTAGSRPTATVGARFCKCKIKGAGTDNPVLCHASDDCPIDRGEYTSLSKSQWDVPVVVESDESFGMPPYFSPDSKGQVYDVGLQNPTKLSAPELNSSTTYVAWHINPHGTEIIPMGQHGTVDGEGVFGVLWTHIPSVNGITAPNTLAFGELSSHYKAGFFGQGAVQYTKDLKIPMLTCGGLCLEICAGDCGWNELENLYLSRVNPSDIRVIAQSRGRVIDLTDRIEPAVIEAMTATEEVLVQPAEVGWKLPGSPLLASVSRDGGTVSMVAVAKQGKLTVLQSELIGDDTGAEEVILPPITITSETSTSSVEPAQTGFGIVLSATERALFVVGGATVQGQWATELRVYDIDARKWNSRTLDGPLPRNVAAATFRAADRSLYVFDQGKDGPHHVARLVRIDLGTMKTRILGSWPRKNSFDRIFISQSWDGNLLLSSSSSRQGRHIVLGVDVSGNKPRVLWGLSGSGAIAVDPTLTGRGLTIPVFEGEGVVNLFISNKDLPATRLDIGACL